MKAALAPAPNPAAAPSFDRLARLYRWMEYLSFGPWLGRCRSAYLNELTRYRYAIVLGDGDGRFTARLLQMNPIIEIDAVDASPAMLRALLRRAGPRTARVRIHCADARQWNPPPHPCDLIVTHFFLDCLSTEEVAVLARKLRNVASPRAAWIVSDFAVPTGWFGRLVAGPIVGGLYWAFGWMTGLTIRRLPAHTDALQNAGFALRKRHTWLGGLLFSELWQAQESALTAEPK